MKGGTYGWEGFYWFGVDTSRKGLRFMNQPFVSSILKRAEKGAVSRSLEGRTWVEEEARP
jgi:hypothetical protein